MKPDILNNSDSKGPLDNPHKLVAYPADVVEIIPTPAQDMVRYIIQKYDDYKIRHFMLEGELESLVSKTERNYALKKAKKRAKRLDSTLDMEQAITLVKHELAKPAPFYGETILEIDVPSGKLIFAGTLAPLFTSNLTNTIHGQEMQDVATNYAEKHDVVSAYVGNTPPHITLQRDGSYKIIHPDYDPHRRGYFYENSELDLGIVSTDTGHIEVTDYQNWLDNGGEELSNGNKYGYIVLNVPKGKYRWTVYSHSDNWHKYELPRSEFVTLELIQS